MITRKEYLEYWNIPDGTPEASEAWAAKVEFMNGKRFLNAPMGYVQRDICYDSPIDGRPITNKYARLDDLRRNNCIEYDPCMKQDAERRKQESDQRLDKAVDEYVDRSIATMPARKREKLAAELEGGLTAAVDRITPPQRSFRDE